MDISRDAFYRVLTKTEQVFIKQKIQNEDIFNKVFCKCLEEEFKQYKNIFWMHFNQEIYLITDRICFCTYCNSRSINPRTMAALVLFTGKKFRKDLINSNVENFKDLFKDQKFIDTENLLGKFIGTIFE